SEANFKNGNLSRVDFSSSIFNRADLSWSDLSRANFRKANLAGANFNWADLNNADLSEAQGFDSITCSGAYFNGPIFPQTRSLFDFPAHAAAPVRNKKDFFQSLLSWKNQESLRNRKDFFESLLSWKNQESLNESLKKSLSSYEKSLMPGVLLYTNEDEKLSLYVRKHFDDLDKLTGDWCTIYLLEKPSPKWRQANHNWRKMIESGLDISWFRTKPYDKSEAYDIARELNVELSNLPCLVLISPENLSERLVFEIQEVSASYLRKLFSTIEKLVKKSKVKLSNQNKVRSQVFEPIKINFTEIVGFLEKHATKDEQNSGVKYFFNSNNLSVSVEPVNIENVNYTDKSRSSTIGNVGGNFNPIASSLIGDGLSVSGTVAESIDFDQDMHEGVELQNLQDEKTLSQTSKSDQSKSIVKVVVIIVIVFAFLAGVAAYIFLQLGLSRNPVPRPSQEQSAM
ncbi:MAG: pentapeptide repeat-containing protein, partial [Moorea sp. SIO4A3]|nr:pentapeptide repeat-containing protein [Moorena sp. SIO4A3]